MIRCTIELVPQGVEDLKKVIGLIEICNDGTGNDSIGNYVVKLLKTPPFSGSLKKTWRDGAQMNADFSKEEMIIIKALGFSYILDIPRKDHYDNFVYDSYQIMVNRVFIDNKQGPAVDALRRCYSVITKCTAERSSKEFKKLAEF